MLPTGGLIGFPRKAKVTPGGSLGLGREGAGDPGKGQNAHPHSSVPQESLTISAWWPWPGIGTSDSRPISLWRSIS